MKWRKITPPRQCYSDHLQIGFRKMIYVTESRGTVFQKRTSMRRIWEEKGREINQMFKIAWHKPLKCFSILLDDYNHTEISKCKSNFTEYIHTFHHIWVSPTDLGSTVMHHAWSCISLGSWNKILKHDASDFPKTSFILRLGAQGQILHLKRNALLSQCNFPWKREHRRRSWELTATAHSLRAPPVSAFRLTWSLHTVKGILSLAKLAE